MERLIDGNKLAIPEMEVWMWHRSTNSTASGLDQLGETVAPGLMARVKQPHQSQSLIWWRVSTFATAYAALSRLLRDDLRRRHMKSSNGHLRQRKAKQVARAPGECENVSHVNHWTILPFRNTSVAFYSLMNHVFLSLCPHLLLGRGVSPLTQPYRRFVLFRQSFLCSSCCEKRGREASSRTNCKRLEKCPCFQRINSSNGSKKSYGESCDRKSAPTIGEGKIWRRGALPLSRAFFFLSLSWKYCWMSQPHQG